MLIFVSPPVAVFVGLLPVAALVISNWFTADAVVWNIICSFPFSSLIPCASSKAILKLLVSKSPPSWGDVSSDISLKPKAISLTSGFVPSLAVAYISLNPLSVVDQVTLSPEPEAYLNWTVYAPDDPFSII